MCVAYLLPISRARLHGRSVAAAGVAGVPGACPRRLRTCVGSHPPGRAPRALPLPARCDAIGSHCGHRNPTSCEVRAHPLKKGTHKGNGLEILAGLNNYFGSVSPHGSIRPPDDVAVVCSFSLQHLIRSPVIRCCSENEHTTATSGGLMEPCGDTEPK
eukprot:323943-Prorocentrum_minimum.AAC.1